MTHSVLAMRSHPSAFVLPHHRGSIQREVHHNLPTGVQIVLHFTGTLKERTTNFIDSLALPRNLSESDATVARLDREPPAKVT